MVAALVVAVLLSWFQTATFSNQLAEQVNRATNRNNGNTADILTAFLDAVQAVEIIGNFFPCVLASGSGERTNSVFNAQNVVLHFVNLSFLLAGYFCALFLYKSARLADKFRIQLYRPKVKPQFYI